MQFVYRKLVKNEDCKGYCIFSILCFCWILARSYLVPDLTLFVNVNVNLMSNPGNYRECLRDHPSQRLMIKCLTIIQIELEFGNVGFWGERKNWSAQRKTSLSKEENWQQTQPTYNAGSGNRTLDTLVGGRASYHCTIPVPHLLWSIIEQIHNMESTCTWFLQERNKPQKRLGFFF